MLPTPSHLKQRTSRIQREWVQACKRENRELPKKVLEEFKKRMKFASKDKANKAKLNFSKCGLDDQLVSGPYESVARRNPFHDMLISPPT